LGERVARTGVFISRCGPGEGSGTTRDPQRYLAIAAGDQKGRPYFESLIVTVWLSGVLLDDPPTSILYSPTGSSHLSLAALKIDRNLGSIVRMTVLASLGASETFSHATKRLKGSPALEGNVA
jgi:hypothetical protein